MKIDSYLSDLASDFVIRDSSKESIAKSFATLSSRLKSYFGNDITDIIKFGSYTRGTILPRKVDSRSDVDVMIVFKNDSNLKPQTFLNRLKDFANNKYSTSEIYQSSPTIVLELQHIKFELVPAYRSNIYFDDLYQIPSNSSTWISTKPKEFDNTLVTCNKNNSYKIKPIIRLLKHWNIENNNRKLPSFELEKNIADNMNFSYLSCDSYSDYVKKGLKTIQKSENYYKYEDAINTINEALKLENDGYPYSAIDKIKKVFPGN